MSDDTEVSIGAFARLSGLSVKALRFYQAQALLAPARVDTRSGYRFYALSQLARADLIRRLRAAQMPLAELRVYLDEPERRPALVKAHRARLGAQAAVAITALSDLDEVAPGAEGPVEPIEWPRTYVLAASDECDLPALARVVPRLFGELYGAMRAVGIAPIGPALSPMNGLDHDTSSDPESVRVVVAAPVHEGVVPPPGLERRVLPASAALRAVHRGHFASVRSTWERLARAAASQGGALSESSFEIYRTSPHDTPDPARWVTECVWLLESEAAARPSAGQGTPGARRDPRAPSSS